MARYQMGYRDGSGADDTIYDTQTERPIAVVTWGCSCCKVVQPEHTEYGQLIVAALNAYKTKETACQQKRKSSVKRKRKKRQR